ncbi:MAG: hypothetical protein HOA17_08980, partial [Candidatus Melainabacteria bacterium]|nr:hypothetical protein [Candidatus Melainabacteria bacterium]
MVSSDPRSKPVLGSDVISGQITDKASALYDLLNQVTGTEGGSYKTFDIDDPDSEENYQLNLGVYNIEQSTSTRAWQTVERIYFQDSGQRLQQLEGSLRDNFDRLRDDITGNISGLFALINNPEGTEEGQGGVVAGDAGLSIIAEIEAIANDENSTAEDVENIIHELLTSEEAISRLIETLFANFQLDVQRLDSEIFDLLNDGDTTFSNSGDSETDTTANSKYFLDFGRGQAAKIANSEQQALEFTLDFLEERHLASFPGAVWNEAAQIGVQV